MLVPVIPLQTKGWPRKRTSMGVGVLSYVKDDDAKVARRNCAYRPFLQTIQKGLNCIRLAEVEFMVLVVENRNILVKIPAAELKVKQDACSYADTFDAEGEGFPVSEAQACRLSAA